MRVRVLPMEEWGRLGESQLPLLLPFVNPENIAIVVVEDEGRIIGTLAALRVTHYEGAWIAPEYRGGIVPRMLLRTAADVVRGWGDSWAFGGAASDEMRDILKRLGAVEIPMEIHAIAIEGRTNASSGSC